jgi:hypothetical protein
MMVELNFQPQTGFIQKENFLLFHPVIAPIKCSCFSFEHLRLFNYPAFAGMMEKNLNIEIYLNSG